VCVTNISHEASEKTVTDFFGFCGAISSITLLKLGGGTKPTQEALIEFKNANAAKTAILLNNALILNVPITVTYYAKDGPTSTTTTQSDDKGEQVVEVLLVKTEEEIENKPHVVPANDRSNTSVIASLLAAGYVLGADAINRARDYDEQHMITTSIKEQAGAIKGKVTELDDSLGISSTASAWAASASNFIGGLGLSEKATMVRQSSANLMRSVGESEVVATTTATLVGVKDAVVEVAGTLKDEASKLMDEPAVKVVTEKLYEGKEAVKGVAEGVGTSVMGVADETSRLISANLKSPSSDDDEALLVVLQEEEARSATPNPTETAEKVNPADTPTNN